MKLVRHGERGAERPALIDDQGTLRYLSGHIGDITPQTLSPQGLDALRRLDPATLPAISGRPRLGVPLAGIGNVIGIGLNYRDHAAEANLPVPTEPIVFNKHTGSLSGPNDPIVMPRGATKLDWEVELGVVIGSFARHVSPADALSHVAGYVVCHDVSERAFQFDRGGQWVKGKSSPTFCPVGPWLVTADEVPDPQALGLWCEVNGTMRQNGSTSQMIFDVATLISHLSQFMTLLPGDLIATGTPAGVGWGKGTFLAPGDVVRLGVDGLGEQRQEIVVER
ncbi:MAG: fumarylacetoacetate hydrolase family protein [Alphaproteobacteria bacterium]|nr:fumarylacetoacetate hydrolase family protein [Alphaproteobacteria bacterium]